jgi:hypothetical protein
MLRAWTLSEEHVPPLACERHVHGHVFGISPGPVHPTNKDYTHSLTCP